VLVASWPLVIFLVNSAWGLVRGSVGGTLRAARGSLPGTATQCLYTLGFLLDQARLSVHAVGVTLWRLFVTRRRLLEWETAAATEQRLGDDLSSFVRTMGMTSLIAAALAVLVAVARPAALPAALPLLLLWFFSPVLAWFVSQPLAEKIVELTAADRAALRRIARKTWGFFETFVGPEDNWLPPDNYQEDPKGEIAHRTSPTNKGLLVLSTLAAHDFGYLSLERMNERIGKTLDTFDKLEKYRGHILNWYDTRSLVPLHPPYVSVVDSGNLLGCLIALRNGLLEKLDEPIPSPQYLDGMNDTLLLVEESLDAVKLSLADREPLSSRLRVIRARLAAPPADLPGWHRWLQGMLEEARPLVELAERHAAKSADGQLQRWVDRLREQIYDVAAELQAFCPWAADVADLAIAPVAGPLAEVRDRLIEMLSRPASVNAWASRMTTLKSDVDRIADRAGKAGLRIQAALDQSTVIPFAKSIRRNAARCQDLAAGMDFTFLFNPERDLFAIGFNKSSGRLDNAHYDLLASECRLASFLAVARGEVARKHWFMLGRPVTIAAGRQGLLSWGGTMFEYLMPRLLLPTFPGTLLDTAERTAVARQIEFGHKNRVPWGVSESGFAVLDAGQTYQYQSFGVPGLGLKRGLQNDVVIAPYACLMAVVIDPHAVRANLEEIRKVGGEGPYGMYEAIDFTRRRVPADKKCLVVKQYMAHHQGMGFIALANQLLGDPMPRRFRAEPMVRANELLLQEKVPVDAPVVIPPEDDESTRRAALSLQMPVSRKLTTADTPSPRTHLLSNGQYTIVVTNAGGGYSQCRGLDVTRYREDRTRDAGGMFFYVRNLATGRYWSVAHHPCGDIAERYEATFSIDKVDFRRLDGDVETHTEITVSPETNVEVRRVTVTNHGDQPLDLDVTSYAEVALVARAADLAHPAFQKLFLETEYVPAQRALLCRRRPRAAAANPVWVVHTVATEGRPVAPPTFETDRAKFLGRRRTAARPAALDPGHALTGTTGPVLDPCLSLRQKLRVEPGASASVAFTTAVADSRAEALSLADQYNAFHAVLRVFDLAWAQSRVELRDLSLTVEESHLYQRLAGQLLFPAPHLRAGADVIRANRQAQSGLWKFGVSGDLPILLVRLKDGDGLGLLKQVTSAQNFWRVNGFPCDVVVLNEHAEGYLEGFHEQILNTVKAGDANALFDRPGGVFVRKADQMSAEDRVLLQACARVVLLGERGPLVDQLDLPERMPTDPPALAAAGPSAGPAEPLPPRPDLVFTNGLGGFTRDGHEYVVTFDPAADGTPMPWSSVVANEQIGFLATESGGGCTWAGNSQLNRLTTWSNDPVSDPAVEAVYVRDEETGAFWSVASSPVAIASPARCRHGQGYTAYERYHAGLEQELRLTVAPDDPVKIIRLRVVNRSGRPRRLSTCFYAELVLGTIREATAMHVVTEIDAESGALFARNAYNPDRGGYVAFVDVNLRPRTVTGDRTEFLGRNGSPADPAGLHRSELSNRAGAGYDPCAAVHAKFDLPADGFADVVFVLGQAADEATARALAVKYREPAEAERAFCDTVARWDAFLSAVSVRTPDPQLDLLVNRWLPYQALACRFWGRTAFYQSGGAFGYRDQLQDSLALVYGRPDLTRAHILLAASRQFREGDTQHWWHPPGGAGVRTRCSDDYLFLPYVTAFYIEKTGDSAVLDEPAPFLTAPTLAEGQDEDYSVPGVTEDSAPLYEHCIRALDRAAPRGEHGLPLMGNGDWNDGMNQVGHEGRGESVWLAWFLADVYRRFAPICEARGDAIRARDYLEKADQLVRQIDQHAWDGAWYRRAWFDDGTPLGSATNDECQIDLLPQAWAAITGGGDPERAARAFAAFEERLVRKDDRLILLFCPPFDHGKLQPGYIKGYVPGIRENGGQYTHAATWAILAATRLGRGSFAKTLVDVLNPVRLTETPERVARYKVEPYVMAADVYGRAPHLGRGGWTWYTGSASWYWRVIVENLLGLDRKGDRLRVTPCIPADWPEFEMTVRFGTTAYHIVVRNPRGVEHGVAAMTLDGQPVPDAVVLIANDGRTHEVVVTLG
jgi:cyclic beta-1,2-glucan synthetase